MRYCNGSNGKPIYINIFVALVVLLQGFDFYRNPKDALSFVPKLITLIRCGRKEVTSETCALKFKVVHTCCVQLFKKLVHDCLKAGYDNDYM